MADRPAVGRFADSTRSQGARGHALGSRNGLWLTFMAQPRNPYPTVDVIIELADGIVLIERRHRPHGWAIPGGFVDYGEPFEEAARREALEETGLDVTLTDLLGVYSDPERDPRHHTVSAVYIGTAAGQPRGGDDAARAVVCDPAEPPGPLVFDHARILADYRHFKTTGERPKPDG